MAWVDDLQRNILAGSGGLRRRRTLRGRFAVSRSLSLSLSLSLSPSPSLFFSLTILSLSLSLSLSIYFSLSPFSFSSSHSLSRDPFISCLSTKCCCPPGLLRRLERFEPHRQRQSTDVGTHKHLLLCGIRLQHHFSVSEVSGFATQEGRSVTKRFIHDKSSMVDLRIQGGFH